MVNHLSANTTGLCEGYHSFIKDIFAGIDASCLPAGPDPVDPASQIRAHYTQATGAQFASTLLAVRTAPLALWQHHA
jgi:hypothetical protein